MYNSRSHTHNLENSFQDKRSGHLYSIMQFLIFIWKLGGKSVPQSNYSKALSNCFYKWAKKKKNNPFYHSTEMAFITSPGDVVHVLPTGAQPGVHVGHLALHQLQREERELWCWSPSIPVSQHRCWIFLTLLSDLKLSDLLAERLSDVKVGDGEVQHRLHDAEKYQWW